MKLTKAALPTGEVSRDDARFSLMEKKLDGITTILSRTANGQQHSPGIISTNIYRNDLTARKLRYGKKYDVYFDKNGIRVTDATDLTTNVYGDSPALESSSFWQHLSDEDKLDVLERLGVHSNNFIPF